MVASDGLNASEQSSPLFSVALTMAEVALVLFC
jgi:hypothetical protein